jgi:hypothetical protein
MHKCKKKSESTYGDGKGIFGRTFGAGNLICIQMYDFGIFELKLNSAAQISTGEYFDEIVFGKFHKLCPQIFGPQFSVSTPEKYSNNYNFA